MAWFSRTYTLGLIFIFLVGIIWAAASVLMQHIYDDMEFRSPFFLTYLTNSLLIIYLPLWQLWVLCGAVGKAANCAMPGSKEGEPSIEMDDIVNELHEDVFSIDLSRDGSYGQIPDYSTHSNTSTERTELDQGEKAPYTHWDVIQVAMVIAPLYVLSNGLYNYSLIMTSVSSSTIISNLSGSFTFAFSCYLGLERFTYGKVLGILACFLGAVCVGLNDAEHKDSEGAHSGFGDIVALFGALCYGMYTTVLKYKIPDDNGISMQLLLGYVGLINAILLAPVLLAMVWVSASQLSHMTGAAVGFMVLSGLFNNVISDYLWARSVVLTSSTVATVGLSITIPLAMVSDFFVQTKVPGTLSSLGAILVIIGFCLVNITKENETDLFMYLKGSAYARVSKEVMLTMPIKRKSSELQVDDLCI